MTPQERQRVREAANEKHDGDLSAAACEFVGCLDEYRSAGKELGRAYRETFGSHYPAMAVVQVAGLVEKAAKIEIEATAIVPE